MDKRDDLTKIRGLGFGCQKLLNGASIFTFADLAKCSRQRISQVISAGGLHYERIDSSKWSQEAKKLATQHENSRSKDVKKKSNRTKPKQRTDSKCDIAPTPITVSFSGLDGERYAPGQPYKIERILSHEEADLEYQARKRELDRQFKTARRAADKLLSHWFKHSGTKNQKGKEPPEVQLSRLIREENVTAVSTRYRTRFGQPISPLEVVICINVDRKKDEKDLLPRNILPKSFDGVPVKVVEGSFRFVSELRGNFLRGAGSPAAPIPFTEPVVGGVPIAPSNNPRDFGTLGVVYRLAADLLGITCNHVVKNATSVIGQNGPNHSFRDFATVLRTISADERDIVPNESVDCAVVKIANVAGEPQVILPPESDDGWARGLSHDKDQVPKLNSKMPLFLAECPLNESNTLARDYPLWKFGNGMEDRIEGRVDNLNYNLISIPVSSGQVVGFKGNFTVRRQDSGRPFVVGGDSGSLLAIEAKVGSRNAFVAIGILFASLENTSIGVGCSMRSVIRALDLKGKLSEAAFVNDWQPRR